MKKYYKNLIICGEIDYHCLLCTESFQLLEDLDRHIRWEKHRKLLKNQNYYHKLKKDFIYMIANKYYYCELCNYATTAAGDEIKKHLNNEIHKNNKLNPHSDNAKPKTIIPENLYGIICLGDKITMNSQQWHGIIDNECLLCSTVIEDARVDEHVTSTDHMIKLINSEIELAIDHFYRKLSDDNAYCFTCKKTVPLVNIATHSSQTEYYSLDRANDKATCRICGEVIHYDYTSLLNHRKTHDLELSTVDDTKPVVKARADKAVVGESSVNIKSSVDDNPEVGESSVDVTSSIVDDPKEVGK